MADIKPGKADKPVAAVKPAVSVKPPVSSPKAALSASPKPPLPTPAPVVVKAAEPAPKPVVIPVTVKPAVPVAKAQMAAPHPLPIAPPPVPVASKPIAVISAVPLKAAEATRAVSEEVKAAVVRATEMVAKAMPKTSTPLPVNPVKGLFDMASSFDPKAFAPTPEAMKSLFGDMQARAKTQIEKSTKMVEEMSSFAKGNVEAMIASGRVVAKGTETMAAEAADYGKKSLESATTAFKGFASAKSPTELLKLQSDFARSSFDAMVAESSKLTEAWLKLAGDVAQPLSTRIAVAADKIKAPLAA